MAHPELSLETLQDALKLLEDRGAPPELVTHCRLVAETASELVDRLSEVGEMLSERSERGLGVLRDDLGVSLRQEVVLRAALHDAGKIRVPAELRHPGNDHEVAGEALLRDLGVPPEVARICRVHGDWESFDDLEAFELIAILADKLWRGRRVEALEERVVRSLVGEDWVGAYAECLDVFDAIAEGAEARLEEAAAARR